MTPAARLVELPLAPTAFSALRKTLQRAPDCVTVYDLLGRRVLLLLDGDPYRLMICRDCFVTSAGPIG